MSINSTKPRVLIIGAGLGGIILAQAFRKHEIPFELFERDESDSSRAQGWAISLHSWFIADLQANTKDDLGNIESVSNTYNLGIPSEWAAVDARNMRETMRQGARHGSPFIRADRAKLRKWALTGLNVHWGKRFEHYEEDGDGVTAYFEDGSSFRGDVLVGADGVASRVRNQLLPNPELRPKKLPFTYVVGEVTASKEQYERWMRLATSFITGTTGRGRVAIALKGVAEDKQAAQYYWVLATADSEAVREDYWTTTASQAELQAFVLSHLDGISAEFADALRATPVEGYLHPPLRLADMVPPELPRGRVTLLGDAVHPMTPFRGEGGNMAMTDGLRLAETLSLVETEAQPVADLLKKYEAEMQPRATKSVLGSRANCSDTGDH